MPINAYFFKGNPAIDYAVGTQLAQRKLKAEGALGNVGGQLGRLADLERLRRENEEAQTVELETRLGAQEGEAQAQADSAEEEAGASTGGAPTEEIDTELEAPGSTSDSGEGALHRVARQTLSPFGLMNRTPPGLERPEIKLARLKGQDVRRAEGIKTAASLQGVLSRSPDPGAILEQLGVPGFHTGSVRVSTPPAKRTVADIAYELATNPDLTAAQRASLERLLHVLKPPPGTGSAGKPPAALAMEHEIAQRFVKRWGREPLDYERSLLARLRGPKGRFGFSNVQEYDEAKRLAGGVAPAAPKVPRAPVASTPPRTVTDPKSGLSIQLTR